jgi:hypothetical protein
MRPGIRVRWKYQLHDRIQLHLARVPHFDQNVGGKLNRDLSAGHAEVISSVTHFDVVYIERRSAVGYLQYRGPATTSPGFTGAASVVFFLAILAFP